MAWHHDRSSSDSEINGFAGYSFGVGARYYYEYEEKIEGDKVPVISSHLGEHLTSENFQAIDQCYNVGLYYDRPYSYNDYSNRRRTFGIRDPYIKPKSKTTKDGIKRYDYWVNFSEGVNMVHALEIHMLLIYLSYQSLQLILY